MKSIQERHVQINPASPVAMLATEKFEGEILDWGFVPLAHEPHAVAQRLKVVRHALDMIVDAAVIRVGPIADWMDACVEAHAGWGAHGS